ncbi:hypothetical protein HDU84_008787 [Entophlyctis sp. JEL0112]|nr:hypothetical protein HDU84_008787 [Entophlyctis sp. JEL0112]
MTKAAIYATQPKPEDRNDSGFASSDINTNDALRVKAICTQAEKILAAMANEVTLGNEFLEKHLGRECVLESRNDCPAVDADVALNGWPVLSENSNRDSSYDFDYFLSYLTIDHFIASELFFRLKISLSEDLIKSSIIPRHPGCVYLGYKAFCDVFGSKDKEFGIAEMKSSKVIVLLVSENSIKKLRENHPEDEYVRCQWETCLYGQEFKKCVVFPVFIGFRLLEGMSLGILAERAKSQLHLFDEAVQLTHLQKVEFERTFLDTECQWESKSFELDRPLSITEFSCFVKTLEHNSSWVTVSIQNCQVLDDPRAIHSFEVLGISLRHNLFVSHLDLSQNSMSDSVAELLGKALSQTFARISPLKVLNLGHNNIGQVGVSAILKSLSLVPLEELNLTHNSLDESSSSTISGLLPTTSISRLDLSFNPGIFLTAASISSSKLLELNVGNTDCLNGDEYMQAIKTSSLRVLHVESCNISEHGLAALQHSETIEALFLGENQMLQNTQVMASLSNALMLGAFKLKSLDLSFTFLEHEKIVRILADGLDKSSSVVELYLRGCCLNLHGLQHIVNIVNKVSCILQTLDLSENNFGFLGIKLVLSSVSLSAASSLKELSLANTSVHVHEEAQLLELLQHVENINCLDINGIFSLLELQFQHFCLKSHHPIDYSPWHITSKH